MEAAENELKLFLKATVMAEAMVVKAQMSFLPVIVCFLCQPAHEKSILKALLMIQSVKNQV